MKKVQRIDSAFEVLRVFLGIVIAYALCLVIIVLITGADGAKDAIYNFAIGPFTSRRRFAQVLSRMCPYMLIGCGMCFVYASGRFSVVSEGIINIAPIPILYVIFCTTFGTQIMAGMPKFANQIIIIVSCAVVGGLVSMIPAYGREKLGANEMVTSTIINYVCLYLALWVVRGYMADRSYSFLRTPNFPDNMRFTRYWGNTNLSEGVWVAIIGVIIACVLFYRTRLGAEIRITGANPSLARYAGINEKKNVILSMTIAGALAGFGAGLFYLSGGGEWNPLNSTSLPAMGFNGIATALLANSNPIGTIFSSLFISHISVGGAYLPTKYFPSEIADLISGIIIYLCAFSMLFRGKIQSLLFRNAEKTNVNAEPAPAAEKTKKEGK